MPRFFIDPSAVSGDTVTLMGENAHHASYSLRLAPGDRISVCDQQTAYTCEMLSFDGESATARILESAPIDTEPPFVARLYQALPKGDKLDTVIQKAVECGAAVITTFESERCVVRAKDGAEEKKVERRRRIALEAAKQSGRGIIPEVHPTVSFKEAIRRASEADIPLFCYEGDGTESLASVLKHRRTELGADATPTVSLVIGSEGGFSQAEAAAAVAAGMHPVGLGKRILRTETAAAFVLSCLVYELELSD